MAFEHGLDRAARAPMHSVVQLEVADRELGLADVIVEGIACGLIDTPMLCQLGVEPCDRIEVLAEIRVIQRLAEVEIAHPGIRGCDRAERGREREQSRHCDERAAHGGYQSLNAIPCSPPPGPDTVMPTSFGPTSLLSVKLLVWRYS